MSDSPLGVIRFMHKILAVNFTSTSMSFAMSHKPPTIEAVHLIKSFGSAYNLYILSSQKHYQR